MTALSFAVLIVHYGNPDDLGGCLTSLATDQTPFDELVVVDNGSSREHRESAEAIATSHGGRLVVNESNNGFGAGVNLGLGHLSNVDVVVLVNPDARLDPGCIERLLADLATNSRAAAAAPLILNQEGRIWYAGGRFGRWQGRLRQPGFGQPPSGVESGPTGFVTGCVLALRLEALHQVGGFDEQLFMYYEDVDLGERLQAAGWELRLVAEATAVHERGRFGDPDRHLGPGALHHTLSSRTAYVRGRMTGVRRACAIAFTPLLALRFAYLVVRAGHVDRRLQLEAVWTGLVEGLRRPPLTGERIPTLHRPDQPGDAAPIRTVT